MKKLRDFKCVKTGNVFERFVPDSENFIRCNCGYRATKLVNSARYFSNSVGRSPSATN